MSKKQVRENPYKGMIDNKKIPILPLDNKWHQLFPKNEKTTTIKQLEEKVMFYVKDESRISQELKKLKKLKKKLMDEIVENMEQVETKSEKLREKKLETSQKLIIDINQKIQKLEDQQIELPDKLRKANELLLYASIDNCYNRIKVNQEKINELTNWINSTREELKRNIGIKQDKEDMNTYIYTYMHDMLGPRFMEIFDENHQD